MGLTFKPGVTVDGLADGGRKIHDFFEAYAGAMSHPVLVTCTTGDPALHGPNDPHTKGNAFDIGVKGLEPDEIVAMYRAAAHVLGPEFTVLFEVHPDDGPDLPQELHDIAYLNSHATGQHLHVQVKKGLTYCAPKPATW